MQVLQEEKREYLTVRLWEFVAFIPNPGAGPEKLELEMFVKFELSILRSLLLRLMVVLIKVKFRELFTKMPLLKFEMTQFFTVTLWNPVTLKAEPVMFPITEYPRQSKVIELALRLKQVLVAFVLPFKSKFDVMFAQSPTVSL